MYIVNFPIVSSGESMDVFEAILLEV